MRKRYLAAIGAVVSAVIMAVALFPVATVAQGATRTWVSGVGDDVNPCSRTAPCKTFAGAISKTAAGGEINVLDPGGFGAVTITKALTISAEYVEAGVLVSGTNGIIVSAGATDVVTLRGLDIEGVGSGINGIKFLSGAALHVQNTTIRGFRTSDSNGILFANSTGISELDVSDSTITDNGSSVGAGIQVRPTGTGGARVSLTNVGLRNNRVGVLCDGSVSVGVNATMMDSNVSGSTNGGVAAGTNAQITVDSSSITGNAAGINSNGAGAIVRVGRSTISGNTTSVQAVGGGVISSYKTNQIDGNVTNTLPAQISEE